MEGDITKERIAAIVKFWYGDQDRDQAPTGESMRMWFMAKPEDDQKIKDILSSLNFELDDLLTDEGESWTQHEDGKLAVILLTDQMSRMIYRKTAKAFSYDHIALKIAKQVYESGEWKEAKYIDKTFFALPYEHSENVDDGAVSVDIANQLYEEYKDKGEAIEKNAKMYLTYAVKHHNILKEFGRYPHRNEVLGRENTPEEEEYLKNCERFGQ